MAYEKDPVKHPNAAHFNREGNNNDTPFGVFTINRKSGGEDASRLGDAYGTGKINLDAVEGEALPNNRTGIAIHGGGSMLNDPYVTDQELKGTAGCVRCTNGDKGYGLGHPNASQLLSLPSGDDKRDKGHVVTLEVAALYLICAIYHTNLSFAQSPYLTDLSLQPIKRRTFNSTKLISKAWRSTTAWGAQLGKSWVGVA